LLALSLECSDRVARLQEKLWLMVAGSSICFSFSFATLYGWAAGKYCGASVVEVLAFPPFFFFSVAAEGEKMRGWGGPVCTGCGIHCVCALSYTNLPLLVLQDRVWILHFRFISHSRF
jgi:hypothetical protein